MDVGLLSCMDVGLLSCMDVGLLSCMDVGLVRGFVLRVIFFQKLSKKIV